MHKIIRIWAAAAAIGLTAAGCVPGAGPAATDSLDLGSLGRFSEPDLTVTATAAEDYNPRGPRSTFLTVTASDAEGNPVRTFTMREDNVSDIVTPAGVGEFPGLFSPPHTRQFTVAAPGVPDASTLFGKVTITELTTGEFHPGVNGGTYDVTHLRASFNGVYDAYGVVEGYLTIG